MPSIVSINPFRCRVWELSERLESQVTEESCKVELESFSRHGQLVPVLGRPLRGDPSFSVEIVCGARRLFVARHLNVPLLVEVREMSDREAIISMDIENRQRADLSPYERGQSYTRWLRAGQFSSQDEIARVLKVSASQVSRLLKLARLPPVIVDAFDSPTQICEAWGLELIEALDDPERRAATIRNARAIGRLSPRPSAEEVHRLLLSAPARGRRPAPLAHDEVVKAENGTPLFRIRHQRSSIAVLLPVERVSAATLESLRHAITVVLVQAERRRPEHSDRASRAHVANAIQLNVVSTQ